MTCPLTARTAIQAYARIPSPVERPSQPGPSAFPHIPIALDVSYLNSAAAH